MPQLTVNSISDLPSAAQQLLEEIKNEQLIALYGEMGAGKTTVIKASVSSRLNVYVLLVSNFL